MKRLLAVAGALSLLAAGAGPGLAAAEPRHGACTPKQGGILVKPGKAFEEVVATPVGAGAGFVDNPQDVGTFYLDLRGRPSSTRGKITFTLSWANPAADYDLIVGGVNELSSDNPEVVTSKASHCKPLRVGVDVFVGVPVDELTLTAKGA